MDRKSLARYGSSQLERFLIEIANLHTEEDARMRFIKKYRHMLSNLPDAEQWAHPALPASPEQLEIRRAANMQSELQYVWRCGTHEARQLRALMLMRWARESEKQSFMSHPEVLTPGPFAQAILYLVNSNRALVCGNPECKIQRYFFRPPDKKHQVYCSEICAEFGQRKAKQKWWEDHGEQWRRKRRKKGKNRWRS